MINAKDFAELCRENKLIVLKGLKEGQFTVKDINDGKVFVNEGMYSNYLLSTKPEDYVDKIIIQGISTGNFYDSYMLSQPDNKAVFESS